MDFIEKGTIVHIKICFNIIKIDFFLYLNSNQSSIHSNPFSKNAQDVKVNIYFSCFHNKAFSAFNIGYWCYVLLTHANWIVLRIITHTLFRNKRFNLNCIPPNRNASELAILLLELWKPMPFFIYSILSWFMPCDRGLIREEITFTKLKKKTKKVNEFLYFKSMANFEAFFLWVLRWK